MKNDSPILLTVCAVAALLAACSKQQEAPAPAASQTPPPVVQEVQKAANDTAAALQRGAEQVKAAAEKAVAEAPPVPPVPAAPPLPQASAPQPSIQGIFDRVKALMSEKKYPEALAALTELSKTSLTAEQQNLAEQLRAQVQKAMASQTANEGVKAVGGLLNQKQQ